jgi:uncharacterized protein YacL
MTAARAGNVSKATAATSPIATIKPVLIASTAYIGTYVVHQWLVNLLNSISTSNAHTAFAYVVQQLLGLFVPLLCGYLASRFAPDRPLRIAFLSAAIGASICTFFFPYFEWMMTGPNASGAGVWFGLLAVYQGILALLAAGTARYVMLTAQKT